MEFTLNQISAAAAILVFICFAIYKSLNNKNIILSDIVIAIIAGGMLPLAIGFALYPFYPHIIGSIGGMATIDTESAAQSVSIQFFQNFNLPDR